MTNTFINNIKSTLLVYIMVDEYIYTCRLGNAIQGKKKQFINYHAGRFVWNWPSLWLIHGDLYLQKIIKNAIKKTKIFLYCNTIHIESTINTFEMNAQDLHNFTTFGIPLPGISLLYFLLRISTVLYHICV